MSDWQERIDAFWAELDEDAPQAMIRRMRALVAELAADDAEEFAALAAYSPLHAILEGVAYPPTLVTTGDHDDRVVPAHSFKFAAELQRAQAASGADAPIVLSIDTRAGHGMGKPKDAAALEFADQLAFAAHHTGLEVAG